MAGVASLYTIIPHDTWLCWPCHGSWTSTTIMPLIGKHSYLCWFNIFWNITILCSIVAFICKWRGCQWVHNCSRHLEIFTWVGGSPNIFFFRTIRFLALLSGTFITGVGCDDRTRTDNYLDSNDLGFTVDYIVTNISFLDLYLKGNVITGQIETMTYRKETSRNTILSARSCHPLHTVKAIPIGELTSTKRNSSTMSNFTLEAN